MKFTLRDLFLVTLIVALAMGWWVDRSRLAVENKNWRYKDMEREAARYGLAPPRRHVPDNSAPAPNPPKE
jgi:hypothetical protein